MSQQKPAKITKAYARGLIAAIIIFVVSLQILFWGLISLFLDTSPVTTDVSNFTAPALIIVLIAFLAWIMWLQTLQLLRGSKPTWSYAIIVSGVAYLVWSGGGMLAGLSIEETWLSVYAFSLAVIWPIGLILFWLFLYRKLYSGKDVPQWPWEAGDEEERRRP